MEKDSRPVVLMARLIVPDAPERRLLLDHLRWRFPLEQETCVELDERRDSLGNLAWSRFRSFHPEPLELDQPFEPAAHPTVDDDIAGHRGVAGNERQERAGEAVAHDQNPRRIDPGVRSDRKSVV